VANEAFARVKIDQLLKDADWSLSDGRNVGFEYPLDDGCKADYALFDRRGRVLAVLEAKSTSVNLSAGEAQGGRYADQHGVPIDTRIAGGGGRLREMTPVGVRALHEHQLT